MALCAWSFGDPGELKAVSSYPTVLLDVVLITMVLCLSSIAASHAPSGGK